MNQSKTKLKVKNHEIVNEFLLIQWNDDSESTIALKVLRDSCPCAGCAGEKDVFGNVYKGPPQMKSDASYILMHFEPVGYYAFKPVWGDGHDSGIFTFDLLKSFDS
jgi:DUF971 family protein